MTVDPRLQLTPGEYLIHPDGSASKVVDKRNMTVDEILATGRYTDRLDRYWVRGRVYDEHWYQCQSDQSITDTHMRLLIERDLHRDECEGLRWCEDHPVPFVQTSDYHGDFAVVDTSLSSDEDQSRHDTLPEAMDAARALAVGE